MAETISENNHAGKIENPSLKKKEALLQMIKMTEDYEKKPLTLEDLDKAFSLAWIELFKQKAEFESVVRDNFEKQNELIKRILQEVRGVKHEQR